MTAALAFQDLSVGYLPCAVLVAAQADVLPGELVFLVGPNGSGKSTLLRSLAGLQRPMAGSLTYAGADVARWPVRRLAQYRSLVLPTGPRAGWLRVRELVALGVSPHLGWHGRLSAAQEAQVTEALELTQTVAFANREVATLSDGERQRVWLARALAQQPRLLLLDEPTHHLDAPARLTLLTLLQQLAQQRRMAIVASVHEPLPALSVADQIWCCQRGQLLVAAPADAQLRGWLDWLGGQPVPVAVGSGAMVRVLDAGPDPAGLQALLDRLGMPQSDAATLTIRWGAGGWEVQAHAAPAVILPDLLALRRWLQAQGNRPQSSQASNR